MSNEKVGTLDNISDLLIVTKITERDPKDEENINLNFFIEIDKEAERILLAEEYEAIVRKQQHMLDADERGKQALISEIAAIKQKQEKRAEALRNRQRALEIEKERSRRIASLPPPLPKSVKYLLRKYDYETNTSNKPDIQMPDELTAVAITPAQFDNEENKENILDPVELEEKRKMQEEWNLKAKKRFNVALKKDRQKEEYAQIMKQIQNAELQNRREMAKNISSDKAKIVPCLISDKFQTAKYQVDMEDAAEKIFKKNNKEHAIEDIEGYHDHYESKYKNIDSDFEEKMIDCVPSFVKENYEYLLEDESKFQGGKNFSHLNDSGSDVLNQAYIETPPQNEEGGKQIDMAIDQLDKLRLTLQTQYDCTVKPLLLASMDIPRKESSDKGVETELFKEPAEDKAVETERIFENQLTPSFNDVYQKIRPTFKRRQLGPFFPSYKADKVPDMHHRDVRYPLPSVPHTEETPPSWSTSSYCSLPSKHGFFNIPGSTESLKCDICTAERENKGADGLSNEHPLSGSNQPDKNQYESPVNKSSSFEIPSPHEKTLSEYVQILAEKYLEGKPTMKDYSREKGRKYFSESSTTDAISATDDQSATNAKTPAFEKMKVDSFENEIFQSTKSVSGSEKNSNRPLHLDSSAFEKRVIVSDKDSFPVENHISTKSISEPQKSPKKASNVFPSSYNDFYTSSKSHNEHTHNITEKSTGTSEDFIDGFNKKFQISNQDEKVADRSLESPTQPSEYDAEVKRLQAIQQVLSRRVNRFGFNNSPDTAFTNDSEPKSVPVLPEVAAKGVDVIPIPHIYHDLSTIHEVDSALTAGSLQLSEFLEESLTKNIKDQSERRKSEENVEDSTEKLKLVSLLNPPDSEISELAKSIHFVSQSDQMISDRMKDVALPTTTSNLITSSKDRLTPSPMSDSESSSSSFMSKAKVFSSSLKGSDLKSPYLKSTNILHKYFKDVGDIKHKKFSSFESLMNSSKLSSLSSSSSSSPILSFIDAKRRLEKDSKYESSSCHTLVSGFISNVILPNSSKDHTYEPTTNQGLVSGFISKKDIQDLSEDSNYRNAVSNRLVSGFISNLKYQDSNSSDSFHPMTPHSNISSPDLKNCAVNKIDKDQDDREIEILDHKKPYVYGHNYEEGGSFKPMTPHSNISTPSSVASIIPMHLNYADSSTESFKPMSPKSTISSPACSSDGAAFNDKYLQSDSSNYRSINLKYNFSSPQSDSSGETISKKVANKYIPQISYNLNLKSKFPENEQFSEVPGAEDQSQYGYSNTERKDHSSRQLPTKQFVQDVVGETKPKQLADDCSSDFFVPQICNTDISSPQSKNSECDLEEGTLKLSQMEKQSDSDFDSKQSVPSSIASSISSGQSEVFGGIKHITSESAEFFRRADGNIQQILSRKPSDSSKNSGPHSLELFKGFKKQYGLPVTSSSSSSSENLSDMFTGSQINYQSTPIKSLEEEMQDEKLISDEELTLVTMTQFTVRPDSPEQNRNPSQSTNLCHAIVNLNDDNEPDLSESACKTPTNESPLVSSDTPSMLSFLHHEMSCMQDKNKLTVPQPLNAQSSDSEITVTTTPNLNEIQYLQKFPTGGYKQRTKRLWNNLEEVKKKKLADEQKKLKTVNRLKAKEYAKKLTPKRKAN